MTTFRDASRPAGVPAVAASGQLNVWAKAGKPAFDTVAACLCLLVAWPLLVLAVILVRLSTPGPAFFRQTRIGQHEHPFVLFKLRTMYADCGDAAHREYVSKLLTQAAPPTAGEGGLYKLANDPRVTPLGRILRRTSIDELPQLFNVIKGDMSLVGPRPVLPYEAELIGDDYRQRYLVRPGLTGLWQVSGRNALSMRQGLEFDVEYVRIQSLAADLLILAKTVPTVLSARGAR
jgi:lipopolysaccharide/colanic/teichoic acid biosynthesis glycosyltransferase